MAIFTIEYALRLIVADSPPRFALSFFGIIDLITTLATGVTNRLWEIADIVNLLEQHEKQEAA